jgi:hypothetical protein
MVGYRSPATNGHMVYAVGKCNCGRTYVQRSWQPITLTWERCAACDEGFPYLHAMWEDYCEAMEDGAILTRQM